MRVIVVTASLLLLAGCGQATTAPAKPSTTPSQSAYAANPDTGPAYTSVASLGQAIRDATGSSLACHYWTPDTDNQAIGTAASGSCVPAALKDQSRILLYDGIASFTQGVDYIKSVNPDEPVFLGKNWILVARDAAKLDGKMPGRLDKNGAQYGVQ